MDLSSPTLTTNSDLTPVFGDNMQDILGVSAIHVNPSAIITVNSTNDGVDDLESGVTTLRDAINQANADDGEDLIVFERSLFSNAQTIGLNLGELDITHNLDIIAPRDSLTGEDLVTVSGNNATRVFEIEPGATVMLSGLIEADGKTTNDGGGIKNSGTLTLDNSIIRGDSADHGGGIANSDGAMLTVSNSTISGNSGNSPYSEGGGIFNNSGAIVTVSNSTINGYNSAAEGGGIYNSGTFSVSNSTISGNSVNAFGGGIYNTGIFSVSNSIISGNSGRGDGAGINNSNGANLTVSNSTISGNVTFGNGSGGGISNSGIVDVRDSTINSNSSIATGGGISNSGVMTVSNSTISGNRAGDSSFSSNGGIGGGINNSGNLTVLFSTLTLNQAANGGGVYNNTNGSTSTRNTIIAANLNSTNGINPDVSGIFSSSGYNLIGDSTGSTGFGSLGDIVGTSDNPIDPRLAPLDFNGGPTQTIALLLDSPAIGAADPTVLDTDPTIDQRGFPRLKSDGSADIGAFEFSYSNFQVIRPQS